MFWCRLLVLSIPNTSLDNQLPTKQMVPFLNFPCFPLYEAFMVVHIYEVSLA